MYCTVPYYTILHIMLIFFLIHTSCRSFMLGHLDKKFHGGGGGGGIAIIASSSKVQ